jgi:hypothetical protein
MSSPQTNVAGFLKSAATKDDLRFFILPINLSWFIVDMFITRGITSSQSSRSSFVWFAVMGPDVTHGLSISSFCDFVSQLAEWNIA